MSSIDVAINISAGILLFNPVHSFEMCCPGLDIMVAIFHLSEIVTNIIIFIHSLSISRFAIGHSDVR